MKMKKTPGKWFLILVLFFATLLKAEEKSVTDAVSELKNFQKQQLNYCYQSFFRINGLYKSSPYVNEVDIAATGFAMAGLIAAVNNNLIEEEKAKNMALETIDSCIKLQSSSSNNYCGFLYHFYIYNEYTDFLEHKSDVEVSTIDTALLLAGIITAAEYFNSKGYKEVKDRAEIFYAQINWSGFFDQKKGLFHMAWRGKFFGCWDFYTDEVLLIAILAQASPNPGYRVDIKESFGNIDIKSGSYKEYEYVYSWYGSLFSYLFAHAFVDFRKVGKDTVHNIDWWQNTKNAISADIAWCKEKGYPKDIWGLSAAWSKESGNRENMEYRSRIGAALCGSWDRYENDKNGVVAVAPYASISSLPFFEEKPLLENPAFRIFDKVKHKAVDRSGLLIESLDAAKVDAYGVPEINSHWLVGIDIVFPALMIENYFSNLIWDNFMKNQYIQFALLKTFPGYYMNLAKK